jgi:hypothetical protein
MQTTYFIILFNKTFKNNTSINPKPTFLATCVAISISLMIGWLQSEMCVLTSWLCTSYKSGGLTKPHNGESGVQTSIADPKHAPHVHAPGVAATVFHEPCLHNRDQCIDLARPSIDGTSLLDSATSLHASINTRPMQRSHCATPRGPAVLDAKKIILLVHQHVSAEIKFVNILLPPA